MLPELAGAAPPTIALPSTGCAWWNLACKGGEQVANAGLSAITKSIASGAEDLLGQIVRIIDQSSTVPLADPVYRHVYFGFLGLAATLIAIVLLIALIIASIRRDIATLGRAAVGVGVAALGGALYIVFAQLLVAVDDWLSHGVVDVTGYDLTTSISQIAVGFHNIAGTPGEMAANMLLILLMLIMLVSGLILWFVLVLRKIAILVVVAFAPLLIAGYGWTPTRAWVRRTTEVLVALVFTKTAIYTLFGIGLALMSRGTDQSLSDFVGTTVLMCGACFAPLVMLKLVHFAGDTHLAHDALSSLHSGVQPVAQRLGKLAPGAAMGRGDLARSQATASTPDGPGPSSAGALNPTAGTSGGAAGAGSGAAAGEAAAGAATGGATTAAFAATHAAQTLKDTPSKVAGAAAATGTALLERQPDQPMRGPNPGDNPGTTPDEGGA
ncbi:MAG: TrbL/VirB6 plasmid conjugal transfer protein [Marmoricola sp.]|nr:TrbL/VirB6 plasmid conjugal transfer protein [Marmoricola sp.]